MRHLRRLHRAGDRAPARGADAPGPGGVRTRGPRSYPDLGVVLGSGGSFGPCFPLVGMGWSAGLCWWLVAAVWVAAAAALVAAEGEVEVEVAVAVGAAPRRHAYASMMYMGTPRDYEFYVATRVMMRSLRRLSADADRVVIASLDVPPLWVQAL